MECGDVTPLLFLFFSCFSFATAATPKKQRKNKKKKQKRCYITALHKFSVLVAVACWLRLGCFGPAGRRCRFVVLLLPDFPVPSATEKAATAENTAADVLGNRATAR